MIVEVKNLVKRYDKIPAIDDLSLSVEKGEIFGLLGPNGSGKTTLINCILALLEIQAGQISVFGKPMKPDAYDIKRDIGIVMQNVAVYPELSVYENVDYFCGLYIKDKKVRKEYVEEAIRFVDLADYKKFVPRKLSGGLLRRLNIACGIAHKPKLLILDEPTVAVDPQSRNHILEGIREMNRRGATVIYTSHYMEEVEQICSRIAILDKGKVIAEGSSDSLKRLIDYDEKVVLQGVTPTPEQEQALGELTGVTSFDRTDEGISIKFEGHQRNLEQLLDFCRREQIDYSAVYSERPSLNDVFLAITGKDLRD